MNERMNRRRWIAVSAATGVASLGSAQSIEVKSQETEDKGLLLNDFQPRSMLRVPQSHVARSRYPVIDFHTHLSWVDRNSQTPTIRNNTTPSEALAVMDSKNIRLMVNLTGGFGTALDQALGTWQKPRPDRFLVFTEPTYSEFDRGDFPRFQADEIESASRRGARGLKIAKTLGLYLRDSAGRLVPVDDRRFDPMWEAAGSRNMPVAIHTSDPEAFFLPIDRFNERFEELNAHPDWSFYGRDYPSSAELYEARNRVIARHPGTHFVLLHLGVAEDLERVSEWLERYPNVSVEFGARIGELGRQPRNSSRFFEKYQDRILFGTDAVPEGHETPQQIFGQRLYEIYYRFLETEDEYFDYAPADVPPQGRWSISGLGLSDQILKKVYHDNAARLLALA